MQVILVPIFLFVIVLPWVIAHHRKHYLKKKITLVLVGSFLLSMVLVVFPLTKELGSVFWILGWVISLIMSFLKNKVV